MAVLSRVHILLNLLEVGLRLLITVHYFDGALNELIVGVCKFIDEVDVCSFSLVFTCLFQVFLGQFFCPPVDCVLLNL